MRKLKSKSRLIVQLVFTALSNGYVRGFAEGKIFTGKIKSVCVPGLNCYSCPGASGSCPIGSLQATLGSRNHKSAFYVLGFLMIVGAFFGRLVCGFLCPFGLVQDLLYKIPFFKKLKKLPRKLENSCDLCYNNHNKRHKEQFMYCPCYIRGINT
jgi:hypothetical protein